MDLNKIGSGKNAPEEINVAIEISMDSAPVKYEFDKETGSMMVDRFIPVSMSYPCNYGFVPNSLGGDGDPIDVLVLSSYPVIPGVFMKVRPIGVLLMEDESGKDEKILAVPTKKSDVNYADVDDIKDIKQSVLSKIAHFFERYKDLEKNKWVKLIGWEGKDKAQDLIKEAIANYK